jgi:hypothetical protein
VRHDRSTIAMGPDDAVAGGQIEAAYRPAATISYTRTRKVPEIAFGRPVWPGARGSKSGTAR